MVESISERISNTLGALPAGERRAAQTLITEYPLIGLKTVAEYAAKSGVSSPTILRFISRIGFTSYPEFQSALQNEVMEQMQSPLVRSKLSPGDNGTARLEPFVEAQRRSQPRAARLGPGQHGSVI